MKTEQAIPNPEYLIKSISEQGYSLETALADLIDNSIAAKADKVEVLTDLSGENLTLFLADNGFGMSESELKDNMQFPSRLMDEERDPSDLGRFGLGMKTASFSQSRRFTVLSRKKGETDYSGRTWDVKLLSKGIWEIIVSSKQDIEEILSVYQKLRSSMLGGFDEFEPNTLIVWEGLYKFDNHLDPKKKQDALNKQLNEVTREYLGIVFHRFMQRKSGPLKIRLNNLQVEPFDPFPKNQGLRTIGAAQYPMQTEVLTVEGFVLPAKAIKSKSNVYKTERRGLMDLEGMYVYRGDRIILFGGWNQVIKKRPNIQLARLKIDVGNGSDTILQLNVAKSNVVIPHDLKTGFLRKIVQLTDEARREYFNREVTEAKKTKSPRADLFNRVGSNKGMKLKFNIDYPLMSELTQAVPKGQRHLLRAFLTTVETRINKVKSVHDDVDFVKLVESNSLNEEELAKSVDKLLSIGLDEKMVLGMVEKDMGIRKSSLPESIKQKLGIQ